MPSLTLALLQTETDWHDAARNRARFEVLLDSAPAATDVFVLPEMFSTGFTMEPEQVAETMQGPTVAWMRVQARERDAIVCGSLVIVEHGRYRNRFAWVAPDGEIACYDKKHGFRMAGEHEHYTPGTEHLCITHKGVRILPAVCYDLRFPVWLREASRHDLLLLVANWPAARASAWRTLLQARAIENQSFVAGVNILGEDGNGVSYCGDSLVVGPDGELLLDAAATPGVHSVRIDTDVVARARAEFPVWQDADPYRLDA